MIPCADQADLDYYYTQLSAKVEAERCGWIEDQFGVSWQLIPARFTELMKSGDKAKSANLMKAMLTMKRLNIADLEKAYY
jgi:predicted 3-demethylubiquinone-9 3-methyltransferase (glyoxalase superfamily)